ncbi:MAG: hypothetical protein IJ870_02100 [Alphaproteobacteria bacterium]|nr:hypothetical protein [Alphaproteobacteria bacterium]
MKNDIYQEMKRREDQERIQNLFRAVLMLAAKDAFGPKAEARKNIERRRDALHFFQSHRDLRIICRLAGADYKAILEALKDKKSKNEEKYNKIKTSF